MSSFTTPLRYEYTGAKIKGRKLYRIIEGFEYRVGSVDFPIATIKVPDGFHTDFASIPSFLMWFIKPEGKHSKAAVIHDYLIEKINISKEHIYTRRVADTIFYEGMLVSGVNKIGAYLIYRGVAFYTTIKPLWDKVK